MSASELAQALEYIIARVGDGHYLRARREELYIDVDISFFGDRDIHYLSEECSVFVTADGTGFMGYIN